MTTASITVSPSRARVGDTVTVNGTNFTPSEKVSINLDATEIVPDFTLSSTATTFSRTFTVPPLPSGNQTITVVGSTSGTYNANLTVTPRITASPTSGIAGTPVTVNGTGFAASENGVTVRVGDTVVSTGISVTPAGSWSNSFTVPVLPGGNYSLQAYGNNTSVASVPAITFQVTPYITLNRDFGAEGETVSVSGFGFRASETNIIVSWNTVDVSRPVQADASGSWASSFVVPAASGGTHDIYARGQVTSRTAVPKLTFRVGAGVSVNKNSAKAGESITVSGAGFGRNETGIVIIFDKTEIPVSQAADETGAWSARFTVPPTTGGLHRITAKGKTTAAASVSVLNFTVLPDIISPETTSGPTGTTVSLKGTGFAEGEIITVLFDGKSLGTRITADSNGSWQATVTIPKAAAGQRSLQVNGAQSGTLAAGNIVFNVVPAATISPTSGAVGSTITLTGSGFEASSKITVLFDNTEVSGASARADEAGNITQTIIVPKASGGSHTLRVRDSRNNSVETTFDIEMIAPPQPQPVRPGDGEVMGFFGNINPTLEWTKVTDPSGVTYNLQVDSENDFTNPQINISGLTATRYTLKKTETLASGQYHWRIQAVDGAGNVGPWSEPLLLVSGRISMLLFIIYVAAAAAVLGLGIFFLMRFIRKRQTGRRPQAAAEIVIPEVVNAEYRQYETEKKASPLRLSLPQSVGSGRGAKHISPENQARLRVLVDFIKSMPLAEPGPNTRWLVELAENSTGTSASPTLYAQLAKGELQLRYEPAWTRHPSYLELLTLLDGQPVLQDLTSYIDTVNRTAIEAETVLVEIHQEIKNEVNWDIFSSGGWGFVSAVYLDAINWFQGKYLKEPSERDYSIKAETLASGTVGSGLYAESG
ncbi:MAG TPA: IPT/TIG domain-containing protein, partial [Dehalococcoidales bacterium]|nr:IPT/TIG domain-containing protein [Dehalococcoidales bacterium]